MRIIDYDTYFHITWDYNHWHKHNLQAVKAIGYYHGDGSFVQESKYIVKKDKKFWFVPGSYRDQVIKLMYTNKAEMILHSAITPEIIGEVPPMAKLEVAIPWKEGVVTRPYQDEGIAQGMKFKRCLIGDEQGLGKAQPLSAKIATPSGWRTMGELKVGDELFGADGKIYRVSGVFPQGVRDVYRIVFNDGFYTECDEEHIWTVRDQNRRKRNGGWTNKTTNELLTGGLSYKTNGKRIAFGGNPILKYEIPLVKAVYFPEKELIIHPYILGMLIGDGSIAGKVICVSIPDNQIESVTNIKNLLPSNLKLRVNRHPACPQYYITQNNTTRQNPFKAEVIRLGLSVKSQQKFIPTLYLQGSIEQRKELLKGLMDSDGSAKQNRITYHTCSPKLAADIAELVQSLGGISIVRKYDRSKHGKAVEYQVNIRLNFCPFKIQSKANQWQLKKRAFASRYIKQIIKTGRSEQQCISVTSPDHLYVTDNYTVTHNTLQSIGIMIGLNVKPVIVICPASTKLNWAREFQKFSHYRTLVLDGKMPAAMKKNWHQYVQTGLADVVIVNYESLKTFMVDSYPQLKTKTGKKKPWHSKDVVLKPFMDMFKGGILDESQRCKDIKTDQAKFIIRIFNTLEYRLLLSGTPILNKPIDLFSQLGIMGTLNRFGGPECYKQRYCDGGKGANNLRELNYLLNLNCFFRREKKDVAKDLPDKQRQTFLCDISNREEYDRAEHDFQNWLKSQGLTEEEVAKKMEGEAILKMMNLKSIAGRGKMHAVKEFVNEILEAGEKLILFCFQHSVVDECLQIWPNAVTVTGRDDTNKRQRNIDAFQNDPKCQLIVCNHKAAGVGITLTASSRVAFIEYPWTYADCVQCEDRAHRIGQKDNVMCTYFNAQNTVDERLWEMIIEKMTIGNTVTGATDMMDNMVEVDKTLSLFNQH